MSSGQHSLSCSLPVLFLLAQGHPGPFGVPLAHMYHLHALIFHSWGAAWVSLGQQLLTPPSTQSSCWSLQISLALVLLGLQNGTEGNGGEAGIRDS